MKMNILSIGVMKKSLIDKYYIMYGIRLFEVEDFVHVHTPMV